jgi:hypothetical protein
MKKNNHAKCIDEKTLKSIVQKLDEVQKLIYPYVTTLTPSERMTLPKMGEKTLAFVEKCHEFAQQNPELCPNYFNMKEFGMDYMDARGLFTVVNMATQLKESLANTQMSAGSEAFQHALLFYKSAKVAAANDVNGANAVYEELRKRFPRFRRRKHEAEAEAEAEAVNQV